MKFTDRMKEWLSGHSTIEALLCFAAILACVAVLAWFYLFSGYGNPPDFVYNQF